MVDKIEGFKNACIECLDVFSLGKLRSYGRSIGVDTPTAKKKGELISDIVAILVGELAPIERSSRGAPIKDDYVDPAINEAISKQRYVWFAGVEPSIRLTYIEAGYARKPMTVQKSDNAMTFEQYYAQDVYKGQLEVIDGVPCLVDKSGRLDMERLCVSVDLIREKGLREGDVITCHAYEKMGVWAARNVLSVNRISIGTENRFQFDEEEITYPDTRIRVIDKTDGNPLAKFLNYVFPIGFWAKMLDCLSSEGGKIGFPA